MTIDSRIITKLLVQIGIDAQHCQQLGSAVFNFTGTPTDDYRTAQGKFKLAFKDLKEEVVELDSLIQE